MPAYATFVGRLNLSGSRSAEQKLRMLDFCIFAG